MSGRCRRGCSRRRCPVAVCWPRAGLDHLATRVASPIADLGLAASAGLSIQDPKEVPTAMSEARDEQQAPLEPPRQIGLVPSIPLRHPPAPPLPPPHRGPLAPPPP